MSQVEKNLSRLIGQKVKQISVTATGERVFLIVSEKRTMTHSEINARFSL
jgi:hypothetical protein